jgi:hypothetical protein
VGNAGRSEAGEKGGDIAGIGNGECARRAVVGERETKKRGSDGVSFDVIEGGKTGDKEGKVGGVVVLHVRRQNPPAGHHANDWLKIFRRTFINNWALARGV